MALSSTGTKEGKDVFMFKYISITAKINILYHHCPFFHIYLCDMKSTKIQDFIILIPLDQLGHVRLKYIPRNQG